MAQRTLDLTKATIDFLTSLPPKQAKQQYDAIIALLRNPQPADSKKLQGYKDLFRLDKGEYRIIYRFDENTIYVALVGKRNDGEVYKQLQRKVGSLVRKTEKVY
jgi:mRNA interferase RelE/StbE